ncbi:MAG: hypothetical protein JXR22_12705 [Prolixibacteraceae bacterium]|nr:hypothetical protein [Prolixibacteraceae bacterium]
MKKHLTILLFIFFPLTVFTQEKRHFDLQRFSVYQGYRSIHTTKHLNEKQLDFLNYVFTKEDAPDYPYFEMATRLRHRDVYQLDLRMALYNNLIPYCFNLSATYFIQPNFGISLGSLGNRFYLTEFSGFYQSMFKHPINTRYIERQWNISMIGCYFAPSYRFQYETIHLDLLFRAGLSSIYPFWQRDIVKEPQTNYKTVFDYRSKFYFLPFVMPEAELSIDFFRYKTAIIGGRIKYSLLYTKMAINYDITRYEWTYDHPVTINVQLSKHAFIQSDIDFGIFLKW